MSQPDLFVVCKNCGSEVSPYVTECPYCGQRVRKRAPKLDRPGTPDEPPRRRRRGPPRLSRLRPDEIEGIAPDVRPYGTLALIAASLALGIALVASGNPVDALELGGIALGVEEEVWRYFVAPFVQVNFGYAFVTLLATGIFGTLLERRFGPVPVVLTFVLAGAAGAAAAVATGIDVPYDEELVYGSNGAALGVLCAWLVDDRRAARRGADRESDLLGVYVVAAALLLLSLAVAAASPVAAVTGAAAGALLGLVLPLFTRR